jgi:hypothetical protein
MSAAANFPPFQTVTYMREHAKDALQIQNEILVNQVDMLKESLVEIQLAIDSTGWSKDGKLEQWDFSWEHVKKARAFARNMFIQNPMVKRAVEVQQLYVWALGFKIETRNPVIEEVINEFIEDLKNQVELSQTALMEKEVNLQVNGNIYWIYFVNRDTGTVRVRTINVDQVVDIYTNPLDSKEVWFYKRQYYEGSVLKVAWHPDWDFHPNQKQKPDPTEGRRNETVYWGTPMSQIKTGGLPDQKYGFPEIHSILAWARAYTKFLENWSTLMESYAVVAMQIIRQSNKGVAAAKDKLASKPSAGVIGDSNPPPGVGSWAAMSGQVELKAVKTSGATTDAVEGQPLAKMIAAGAGLPITFFGDADIGNRATAATLDRPTELKMVFRQNQWANWLIKMFRFVLLQSASAEGGKMSLAGVTVEKVIDISDGSKVFRVIYPEGMDSSINIEFPDITEPNATERVRAIVMAVTMMGKPMTSIFPNARDVALLVARALGLKNPEALVDMWYPPGQVVPEIQDLNPEIKPPMGAGGEEADNVE